MSRVWAMLLLSALGVLWWNVLPTHQRDNRALVAIGVVWIVGPLFWVMAAVSHG
jgi:drug/metabolite transporter superfamily protein YnfA